MHDVTRVFTEHLSIQCVGVIESNTTLDAHTSFYIDPIAKKIQQRSLASSRCAHYESNLARQAVASHSFKDMILLFGRLTLETLFSRCFHGDLVVKVCEAQFDCFASTRAESPRELRFVFLLKLVLLLRLVSLHEPFFGDLKINVPLGTQKALLLLGFKRWQFFFRAWARARSKIGVCLALAEGLVAQV